MPVLPATRTAILKSFQKVGPNLPKGVRPKDIPKNVYEDILKNPFFTDKNSSFNLSKNLNTKLTTTGGVVSALSLNSLLGDPGAEAQGEPLDYTPEQLALQDLLANNNAITDNNISRYIQQALSVISINPSTLDEADSDTLSPPSFEELPTEGIGALLQGLSSANPDGSQVAGGTHVAQFLQQAAGQNDENEKINYENARKQFEDAVLVRKLENDEKKLRTTTKNWNV